MQNNGSTIEKSLNLTNKVQMFDPLEKLKKNEVKIHDAHCHYSNELEKYLIKFGINSLSLMPSWIKKDVISLKETYPNDFTNPDQYFENFKLFKKVSKTWTGNLYLFIPIDFTKPPSVLEDWIVKYNPAGIKLHPFQNYYLNHSYLDPYFSVIQKHNLVVYVHTDVWPDIENQTYGSQMKNNFGTIVELYPNIKFIMGHAGNSDSWLFLWKFLKKHPNVVAESSLSPAPQELEKSIRKYSSKSIIFGSNFPFTSPKVEIMKLFKMHKINQNAIYDSFGKNSIEFLNNCPFHCINSNFSEKQREDFK